MRRPTPSLDPIVPRDYASRSMLSRRVSRAARPAFEVRHLRAPSPIRFPEEAEVPESIAHLVLRTFLFRLLRFVLGPEHSVGSDQFVYWLASDPTRCLAPDVFVRLEVAQTSFGAWKTWEHGAPDLAVDIVSESDRPELAWAEKLARYHELGVSELVRFDPSAPEPERLRVWDRLEGDFVERATSPEGVACLTLGLRWVVAPVESEPVGLRLADVRGRMLEAPEESAARRAAEQAERAREQTRRAEEEARRAEAAEARVRELEAQLRAKR